MRFKIDGLEAKLNNSVFNSHGVFLFVFFPPHLFDALKWKVDYSISSKGCSFEKPEQGTEVTEQGTVEGLIS